MQARPGEDIFLIPEAQPAPSYASIPSGHLPPRGWVQRMEVASRDGKNTSLDLHPQRANFASLHVSPFEITPKASFSSTGSAQERKQCLCMDPPGLQEIAMFTEGWDESTVCPCRNTLWDYYRDVCGVGREGVALSRAGSTGKGRLQCKEKSAAREGLTKRNDHVDCVTVPSFSWTQNGNFQVLFMSLRLLENYSWVFKIVF